MTRAGAGAPGHARSASIGEAAPGEAIEAAEAVDKATVDQRLDERAEVFQRFAEGDVAALTELLEHATGTPVAGHALRYPERTAR